MASFSQRLYSARLFLGSCFVAGIIIAIWDPATFVFTFAIGLTAGILILGPIWLRLSMPSAWKILEWQSLLAYLPICYGINRPANRLFPALVPAPILDCHLGVMVGTAIGHDATLAALELRSNPHFDLRMVATFPLLIGLAVIAGYSTLDFLRMYTFAASAIG